MDLIEEILAKHHRSPTSLHHPNIRVRKYMNIQGDFVLPQKEMYTRNNWLSGQGSPKMERVFQSTFTEFRVNNKVNEGYVKRNIRNVNEYMNQEGKEWPTRQLRKQLTITINPNESKSNNHSLEHRARTFDKISQKEDFQLQVNQLSITQKKQSKRKQVVKSLKRQSYINNQLETIIKRNNNSPPTIKKMQSTITRAVEKEPVVRVREKGEICGWEDGDSFQD